MSFRILLSLIMIVALFTFNVTSSTINGEEKKNCKVCKNTGRAPNPPFADRPDTMIDTARLNYPSKDLGLGWLPCVKGEEKHPELTKKAREDMDIVRKQLESFLEGRRNIYDFLIFGPDYLKEGINHIELDHFDVISTLEGEKIYKKKLSGHQRTRLYCFRLEECFNLFCELIGIKKNYKPVAYGNWQIFLWGKVEQQLKASHKLIGNTQYPLATGNARIMTVTPYKPLADGRGHEKFLDDELYHYVFHNTVHLFFEEWGGWVDGAFPMWFYEGTAHWLEYKTFNRVGAHCSDEGGNLGSVKDKKWERLVFKLIIDKKDLPFNELIYKKMQDLNFNDRLKGWSIIDWMYNTLGAKKIQEFIVSLKKSKNEAQAWRDVFGLTIDEIDGKWRKWVKVTYGPRKILKVEKANEVRLEKFIEHQKALIKLLPY